MAQALVGMPVCVEFLNPLGERKFRLVFGSIVRRAGTLVRIDNAFVVQGSGRKRKRVNLPSFWTDVQDTPIREIRSLHSVTTA